MSKEKDKQSGKDWNQFKKENAVEEETQPEDFSEELFQESDEEAALDHPSYLALQEQLTLTEQKAYENKEMAARARAELENERRRMKLEVEKAHKYGVGNLLTSLLPVVDSLDQALQIAHKNSDAAMHEGLDLTMKLFMDVLQKFDVECIDPLGELFDPQQHEAMSIQEAPDAPSNSVLVVFQKGYKLRDRLIRPARVIVSKNKSAEENS